MFVSRAAFSLYRAALVIILPVQFLQPLVFLLALFGFDWIPPPTPKYPRIG